MEFHLKIQVKSHMKFSSGISSENGPPQSFHNIHVFFIPLPDADSYKKPEKFACENQWLKINCPAGQYINIIEANYGRRVIIFYLFIFFLLKYI